MELRHLRYFVTVAETLHFGRAARRLHMSQPPLSQQIKQLEDEIGVPLLVRTSRSVSLTPAGQAFAIEARRTMAAAEACVATARRVARGSARRVRLGFCGAAAYEVLPTTLAHVRQHLSEVTLEVEELASARQVKALQGDALDVGLVTLPLATLGLTTHVLSHDGLVVAMPEDHPLAARRLLTPTSIVDQPLVTVSPELEPGWSERIQAYMEQHGIVGPIVQVTDSKISLLGLVASHVGIAVLASTAHAIRRAGVVYRPLQGTSGMLELAVIHRPSESSEATLAVVKAAIESHRQPGMDGPTARRGRHGDKLDEARRRRKTSAEVREATMRTRP